MRSSAFGDGDRQYSDRLAGADVRVFMEPRAPRGGTVAGIADTSQHSLQTVRLRNRSGMETVYYQWAPRRNSQGDGPA